MGETRINVKNMTDQTKAEVIYQNNITYTPKVSVVIPVYNVEPYLRQCLDSVINQTLQEIEIICIDDGSTDKSLSILKEYAEKDNRITVLSQQNLHAGVARNAGLAVAKGEYLSFLDSDDFFELNMLEELHKNALKNDSDIVMCDTWLFDEQKNEDLSVDWTLRCDKIKKLKTFSYKDIPNEFFKLSNCWVWNRLYKTSFIKEQDLHFQNLGCANDIYFSCIAGVSAEKISFLNKKLIHYRINQKFKSNLTSVKARITYPTEMLRCFFAVFSKLQNLDIYNDLKSTYLHVAIESLYWTMNGLKSDPQAYAQFKDYLKNYKDILCDFSPFKNNTLNLKYSTLRNILVDEGIYYEIPKRIFYVWGANEPLKPDVIKCIDTWKKFLPDYEIIQINDESIEYFNFQKELKENKWFRTVYERKMWAFVADYVRIKALYLNGGIYFDTDVSVVQNMDKFLTEPAFVGIQMSSVDGTGDWVEPAICGARKNNAFFGKVSSFYEKLIWEKPIYTMPHLFDYYLREYDIYPFKPKSEQKIIHTPDLTIYPEEYFIPYRFRQKYSDDCVTENTHTIHWWGGSWTKPVNLIFLQHKHLLNYLRCDSDGIKVSVIICVYNSAEYLRQCLDSVINQTLKNIEIICVNDGSTDNSLEILQEYAQKDNRIKIISQENAGLSISRNNAMKVAMGEYIQFLDSDDWLRADALEYLYLYSAYYNLDMLLLGGINFNETTQNLEENTYYSFTYMPKKFNRIFNAYDCLPFITKMAVSSCLTFYNRKFLNDRGIQWIGKKIFYEDNLFFTEAILSANKISYLTDQLYFRRIHSQNITGNMEKYYEDFLTISLLTLKKVYELKLKSAFFSEYYHSYIHKCFNIYCSFSKENKIKQLQNFEDFCDDLKKNYSFECLPKYIQIFLNLDINEKYNIENINKYITETNKQTIIYTLFGIKIWKIKKTKDGKKNKHYLFGIPIAKVKQKNKNTRKVYILGIPLLKRTEK